MPSGGLVLGRGLAGAALTLLCVLLPALVGGIRIDAPARPGETERLVAAMQATDSRAPGSRPAHLYYTAALPAERDDTEPDLARARLASVGGLFVISGLLYMLLTLARRRSTGLLACLSLAALPPVWADGAVLRPEVPAAVFGGLAMVLLAGFPRQAAPRRGRRAAVSGWGAALAAMAAIGACIGLAAACVPASALLLLVPGGAMLLVVGALGLAAPRVLRRLPLPSVPVVAMQRRLLPWVLLSVVNLVMALLILDRYVVGEVDPTVAEGGLLPDSWLAAAPLLVLAALGGGRLLLGVALRFDRSRKVSPDVLILLYVGVLLGQRVLGDRSTDALMAAPAFSILIAEGLSVLLVVVVGKLMALESRRSLEARSQPAGGYCTASAVTLVRTGGVLTSPGSTTVCA